MITLHIARHGQSLGSFSEHQIREGIASGQFRATDLFWTEGMTDWRPLGELAVQWGVEIPVPPRLPFFYDEGENSTIRAAEGIEPAWERRKEIGFFPAILQTITSVLFRPNATFTNLKQRGGFGAPVSYYLLVTTATVALILAMDVLFFSLIIPSFSHFSAGLPNAGITLPSHATGALGPVAQVIPSVGFAFWMFIGIAAIIYLIIAIITIACFLFVGAGMEHLILKLIGGAKRPFETTFRVYAYVMASAKFPMLLIILLSLAEFGILFSYGTSHHWEFIKMGFWGILVWELLSLLPLALYFTALIWAICCQIIGLKSAHAIQWWKAALAVLLPIIICCGGMLSLYAALIGAVLNIHPPTPH